MSGAEKDSPRARRGRDADDIRRRLDTLVDKLASAQARHAPPPDPDVAARGRAMGQALRLATELVAGVVVGGFIGWALDRWLGTTPLLMVVFLLLGAAAGIMNVIRTAKAMQQNVPPGKDLKVDDDDD
jgi:ATP synthase protein I